MSPRPWGIVLDADVFLRSSARDLFLYLAALGIVDLSWSVQILDEVARNFPGGRERFRNLRVRLETAYPEALKAGFEHRIAALTRTNGKDRHVLALAAEYEADLVSFNYRDFDSEEASSLGVAVWPPDDALEKLIQQDGRAVRAAAERAFLMLRNPPVRWAAYMDRVRADGMPKVADRLALLPEPPGLRRERGS